MEAGGNLSVLVDMTKALNAQPDQPALEDEVPF
jgi:hypothetical protein